MHCVWQTVSGKVELMLLTSAESKCVAGGRDVIEIFFTKEGDRYVCSIIGKANSKEYRVLGMSPLIVLENGLSMFNNWDRTRGEVVVKFSRIKVVIFFFSASLGQKTLNVEISQKDFFVGESYSFNVKLSGIRYGTYVISDNNFFVALELTLHFASTLLGAIKDKKRLSITRMDVDIL